MLGMALIGGRVLIRIYFLVSMLREGRQGMDKEMTAAWLEDASSTYISVCVCLCPPFYVLFQSQYRDFDGVIDRRQSAV